MSDAARRFAARNGLNLEVAWATTTPAAVEIKPPGELSIANPGSRPNDTENCPNCPNRDIGVGAKRGVENPEQFQPLRRSCPNRPSCPKQNEPVQNAWHSAEAERRPVFRSRPPPTPAESADDFLRAALKRPPSWWQLEEHRPPAGARCSCCHLSHWWTRDRQAWCCFACHPPLGIASVDIEEVRT